MTLVAMAVGKYQSNVMVAGESDNLDNYSFSRNLFSLVELHTMDMAHHIDVKTSIRDVTAKVKS